MIIDVTQPTVFSTATDHSVLSDPSLHETRLTDLFRREDPTNDFVVEIPWSYDHTNHLVRFQKQHGKKFFQYDPAFVGPNFCGDSLEPRKRYRVRIEPVTPLHVVKTSEECLSIYRGRGAIFPNAQGLALAYEQAPDRFPLGQLVVSFGYFKHLWRGPDGHVRVPCMLRRKDNAMEFKTVDAVTFSHCNFCLLLFFEFLI